MNTMRWATVWVWCLATVGAVGQTNGSFVIGEKDFLLDGKPFVIRAGEMHYPRIPREYWAHRLKMVRAMGLNTVSTYAFWNFHESRPNEFRFTGEADIAEYCRLAQREGLKVIVRPGPYVCAEWDFGGLPWWLLKEPGIQMRTRDERFLAACQRWFEALGKQLGPLQTTKGGPILMVQIENEYGSFGRDKKYLERLRDGLRGAGFEVPLFTSDQVQDLRNGCVTGALTVVNFHQDPAGKFAKLREIQPAGPSMCGEYYAGWFSNWGQPHRPRRVPLEDVEWMLKTQASFTLYMVHGGTSFGFQSGANGPPYWPQVTSYDYGAPISEAGWPTDQYGQLRELVRKYLPASERLPELPASNRVITIPPLELKERAALFENLPEAKKEMRPRNLEAYDQAHGCILYRARLPAGGAEELLLRELGDVAWVFLDGTKLGMVERRLGQRTIKLPGRTNAVTLDILVEAMGRVNYGQQMHDRKGITEKVQLVGGPLPRELTGWEVFNLPLNERDVAQLNFGKAKEDAPTFYRARFNLQATGDTFLDMSKWGKGMVWINGHNLGRFWRIGPQQTLYCPGPWLNRGQNELIALELLGTATPTIQGVKEPVLDRLLPSPPEPGSVPGPK